MTATNEPRVSDEDREAAIDAIYETPCFNETFMDEWHRPTMGSAIKIIDTLLSHGWGPRPAVDPTKLGEFIDAANAGGMAVPWRGLQDYLRECGIEVTDD